MTLWVIWSEEHIGWWGPDEIGYTTSLARAGRYSERRARKIVDEANRYSEEGEFNEVAFPDPIGTDGKPRSIEDPGRH